ncbi:hypothetical protein [Mycobacterium camsae]|uniref:hypothetical protein n=1 Tax=Mycobacterium gordonae TaxID=1778 RepID=UPI00197E8BEE|nr:hypothetical protein [Mycobacterium gordonae]
MTNHTQIPDTRAPSHGPRPGEHPGRPANPVINVHHIAWLEFEKHYTTTNRKSFPRQARSAIITPRTTNHPHHATRLTNP